MSRKQLSLILALTLAGCSPKAPASKESAPRPTEISAGVAAADPAPVAQVPVPPPDPREATLSAAVLQLLEQEHLLHKKIDDTISREAFATYVDRLDAGKMFLLKSDRDTLARHTDTIDDELRSGSLDLAHDGAKLFAARVGVVEKVVAAVLAGPLDHSDEEWIELDPKKVEFAKTEDELRDRWKRRLELEVLERVGQMEDRLRAEADKAKTTKAPKRPKPATPPGVGKDEPSSDDDDDTRSSTPIAQIPTTPEGRETKARTDLAKTYAGRFARLHAPRPLDAAAEVINAITTTLDPHTDYLPPADKANFDIQMSGTLEGIGAVLREKDHYTEVVSLVPGGASWRHGGLTPGDVILSVAADGKDPIDVFDMRIDEVVKMIRGKKGTIVRLHVQKADAHEETLAITRDVVVIEDSYARGAVLTRNGQPSYGYIHLPGFYGGNGSGARMASSDVRRLLAEMKARKVRGVILDIRSNGGGLLRDAVELTGLMIDKGPVVQVEDGRGQKEVLSDERAGEEYDGPLVVLVDRFSASASEILAGALQDYGRAIIVGTGPTHGKGTVQTLANLDALTKGKVELGVLKITIQQFFRVSGSSTQLQGVVPDIMLPDPAGHIDAGERSLDHAIAWSSIAPAKHDQWPVTYKPTVLVQHSAARVAKQPLLSKIATTTALLRARKDDTRVPLARPAWEKRRTEQRVALEAASPDLKKAPAQFAVKVLDEATPLPPGPGAKTDGTIAHWRDNLARDPWVDECVSILGDMAATK